MPLYDYLCPAGHRFDVFLPMSASHTDQVCPHCSALAAKQLSAPAVRGDYSGYRCPITDKWIEGRRAHEENLKQHGCRVFEPGEKEAVTQIKAAADRDFDRRLDETLDRTLASWSPDKVARLCNEVADGASAQVTRATPQ